MGDYISINDALPEDGQRVITKYDGVYEDRGAYKNKGVLFWLDRGSLHFGGFDEIDGKGSQPATHWKPLND